GEVAIAATAVAIAAGIELSAHPEAARAALNAVDPDDAHIAGIAPVLIAVLVAVSVPVAAAVRVAAAVLRLRAAHRFKAAAAYRLAVGHIVAVAEQLIDDLADHVLVLRIAAIGILLRVAVRLLLRVGIWLTWIRLRRIIRLRAGRRGDRGGDSG